MTDYSKHDSIDPSRMERWNMASKLPYTITEGVVATREGLVVHDNYGTLFCDDGEEEWYEKYEEYNGSTVRRLIPVPDAAERLRYREGEPSVMYDAMYNDTSLREPGWEFIEMPGRLALHRLAAILCDDAEGFRVLHFCINNLCNTRTGTNPVETDGIIPDGEPSKKHTDSGQCE
jgi:hypothetical protein